jgi:hypothetical protein
MRPFFARTRRLLASPLDLLPRSLLVGAAVLTLTVQLLPLWNLTMFAPQYPRGLTLDIYSHTLRGGNNDQDITEINILNHYIGMQDLDNESFQEFKWMPFGFGALALLMLRAAVLGTAKELVDVLVLFAYFGAFSLWSFGYKLYRYGHDLAPTASVKVDPFMPPMFGPKRIANFEVYSYPSEGTYVLVGVVLLLVIAFVLVLRGHRATEVRSA